MIDKIKCKDKYGTDIHKYLIALLQHISRTTDDLPDTITKDEYAAVRNNPNAYADWYVGLVGFCASYNAKWFGGYARDKVGTNHAAQSKKSLLRDMATLSEAEFLCRDYRDVPIPKNAVVYADPPYSNTTGYSVGKFDSEEFWKCMRLIAQTGHTVFISEQTAPDDFVAVWEKPFTRTLDRDKNNQFRVSEKLFTYGGRMS